MRSTRASRLLFVATAAAFLVPVALVRYPPVLDLAQQMAQLPLLERVLGAESDAYRITWLAPNRLAYPLLGLGWLAGGAEHGPRIALALVLLATLGALHLLGALFERPLANVALASVFVLSSSLYGGFFGFLLGAWPFAFWLREIAGRGPVVERGRAFVRALVLGLIFLLAHLIWIPAALGLLVLGAVVHPPARRHAGVRALALAPLLLAGVAWTLATRGLAHGARVVAWELPLAERLTRAEEWPTFLLGGLRGAIEPLVLGAIGVWVAAALLGARGGRTGRERLDPILASAALAFFAASALLPDTVDETWLFGRRWGWLAGACFVLALPPLRVAPRRALAVALLVPAALLAATLPRWLEFDRVGMAGFDDCRRLVPEGARLLFLDFARVDPAFAGHPTFQMAAYAQLDRPVELGFSFAEHRSSLVTYRERPRAATATPLLEHFPERVQDADLDRFDLVLLHLPATAVEQLPALLPRLEPFAGRGGWRLCRIRAPAR